MLLPGSHFCSWREQSPSCSHTSFGRLKWPKTTWNTRKGTFFCIVFHALALLWVHIFPSVCLWNHFLNGQNFSNNIWDAFIWMFLKPTVRMTQSMPLETTWNVYFLVLHFVWGQLGLWKDATTFWGECQCWRFPNTPLSAHIIRRIAIFILIFVTKEQICL